ncbi:hypothetical protein FE257_009959 [Aspergillus nanangensis]|uniref:Uncharacterized protein n=1 Tax=Aspergillus nanangensis TaxID=2582783 RepID=A0AAD4GXG5_ASPNN|nr:hypothetical protein FE257_009959 [Aspergillus nanangensis]
MKFNLALLSLVIASAVAMPASVQPRQPAENLLALIQEMGGLHQVATDLFTKYIQIGGTKTGDAGTSGDSE